MRSGWGLRAFAVLACWVSLAAAPALADAAFVNYDQDARAWGKLTYAPSGTMAATGCGPTAVAMAVRHLTGRTGVNPMTIANRFGAEYHDPGRGSFHSLIPVAGEAYGLQVRAIKTDFGRAQRAIESGGLVIALVRGRPFTWRGHFIVLRAMRGGKFRVSDPNGKHDALERRGFSASQLRAASVEQMWAYMPGHGIFGL